MPGARYCVQLFPGSWIDYIFPLYDNLKLTLHPSTDVQSLVFSSMPATVPMLERQLRIAGLHGEWSKASFIMDTTTLQREAMTKASGLRC